MEEHVLPEIWETFQSKLISNCIKNIPQFWKNFGKVAVNKFFMNVLSPSQEDSSKRLEVEGGTVDLSKKKLAHHRNELVPQVINKFMNHLQGEISFNNASECFKYIYNETRISFGTLLGIKSSFT